MPDSPSQKIEQVTHKAVFQSDRFELGIPQRMIYKLSDLKALVNPLPHSMITIAIPQSRMHKVMMAVDSVKSYINRRLCISNLDRVAESLLAYVLNLGRTACPKMVGFQTQLYVGSGTGHQPG
ncbi:MAG: hypothetical protein R3301_14385 [Saprospiraceae bacterium]|nr:hypothetical protein [Saprospiraceae bacterium]